MKFWKNSFFFISLFLVSSCFPNSNDGDQNSLEKQAVEELVDNEGGLKKAPGRIISSQDPSKIYLLGLGFLNGWGGLEQNTEEAIRFFTASASQGELKAVLKNAEIFQNAELQFENEDIPRIWINLAKKVRPFVENLDGITNYKFPEKKAKVRYQDDLNELLAKEVQNSFDHLILSSLHLHGRGFPPDAEKSFQYIQLAAEAGNLEAMSLLSPFYLEGKYVDQNFAKSLEFLHASFPTLGKEVFDGLSRHYLEGLGVEENFSKGFEYAEFGAVLGFRESQNRLFKIYLNGLGVPKDEAKGLFWLKKAAGNFDSEARGLLGKFYLEGKLVEQNIPEGRSLIKKAAWSGDTLGGYLHGILILSQPSVTIIQSAEALTFLKSAACDDLPIAQFALSNTDFGIPKSPKPLEKYYWVLLADSNSNHDDPNRKSYGAVIKELERQITLEQRKKALEKISNREAVMKEICPKN